MNKDQPLEERTTLTDAERSVARRINVLEKLPITVVQDALDAVPSPVLIYCPGGEVYPNQAAIKEFDRTFEDLLYFSEAELVTGNKTQKVRNVLKVCERVGWNEPDFAWSVKEKNGNKFLFEPHMSLKYMAGQPYWTANIPEVKNIDPKTARGKMRAMARSVWQRCQSAFQRDLTYVNAPEHLTEKVIYEPIKAAVISSHSLMINLKNTKTMDNRPLDLLREFSIMYGPRLFLLNVQDEIYSKLREHNISKKNIYHEKTSKHLSDLRLALGTI